MTKIDNKVIVRKLRNARLRGLAQTEYVASPHSPSIEDLHNDSRFKHLHIRTLERWAKQDHWVEKRKQYYEQWTNEVRARLGSQMVKHRVEEIALLNELKAMAMDKLKDEMTLPKSFEGVMKVLVDVIRTSDDLRDKITNELAVGGTTVVEGKVAAPDEIEYDSAELEAAAAALLEKRRDKQQQLLTGTVVETELTLAETNEDESDEEEQDDAEIFDSEQDEIGDLPSGPSTTV